MSYVVKIRQRKQRQWTAVRHATLEGAKALVALFVKTYPDGYTFIRKDHKS